MDRVMKDNFHKDVNMELVYINGQMVILIMDHSIKINDKDLDSILGRIMEFIGVNGKKIG
jgi:hypothetical protein